MGKRILIFSDGTGNAGGITPDEDTTNVYKLYRATRSDPETVIDANKQVAFYDPGLGTGSGSNRKTGWRRRIYNTLSQATGLGISKNIIDCYSYIIRVWEPGDRIYLFGFSRGAYTVRCLGGVLGMCGIPTKGADGSDLKLDPDTIRSVATSAVRGVYEHGLTTKHPRFASQRKKLAELFRMQHESCEGNEQGAVPHLIAVWDTVAALGISKRQWLGLASAVLAMFAISSFILAFCLWGTVTFADFLLSGFGKMGVPLSTYSIFDRYWLWYSLSFAMLLVFSLVYFGKHYMSTRLKFTNALEGHVFKTMNVILWKLKFYDTNLDIRVKYARHALSIDEYREDFERVPWGNVQHELRPAHNGVPEQLQQIWFAGNHADVGGGYPESEARLSDISLRWIVDFISSEMPQDERVEIDGFYLRLTPSPDGLMHDECKRGIGGFKRLEWDEERRSVPIDAVIHPSVYRRFSLQKARHYDGYAPYRPESLRRHNKAKKFYK